MTSGVHQAAQNLPHSQPHLLESEEEEERHHKAEQTHGLGQSEPQDGVGEQLLLQARVPGITNDEGAEHGANTGARPGNTDCCSASTDELGRGVDVPVSCAGLQGASLVHCKLADRRPLDETQTTAGEEGQSCDSSHVLYLLCECGRSSGRNASSADRLCEVCSNVLVNK